MSEAILGSMEPGTSDHEHSSHEFGSRKKNFKFFQVFLKLFVFLPKIKSPQPSQPRF